MLYDIHSSSSLAVYVSGDEMSSYPIYFLRSKKDTTVVYSHEVSG